MLVLHVDDLATAVAERADAATALYRRVCREKGFEGCDGDPGGAALSALEVMAKEAAFVVSAILVEERRERLLQARAVFSKALEASLDATATRAAIATANGGGLVARISRDVAASQETLRVSIDQVLERSEAAELQRVLAAKSEFRFQFNRLLAATILSGTPYVAAESKQAALFGFEYLYAQVWLGKLRALAQRLNKDNLLHRLRIGEDYEVQRRAVETASRIDEAIRVLGEGDPLTLAPRPPNRAIEGLVEKLEREWTPIRQLALANPFDYLRRREGRPSGPDPLHFRYFEREIAAFAGTVDEIARLYTEACERDGYDVCEGGYGRIEMRAEELLSAAVRGFAGMDASEGLTQRMEAFERAMAAPTGRRDLDASAGASTAPGSEYALEVLDETRRVWTDLRRELEVLIEGTAEASHLRRAIELQRNLVIGLERLEVAVVRVDVFEGLAAAPDEIVGTPSG